MADIFLRELERSWQATADPVVGMRLILAKFRAGQAVDLDSFPLELWHRIATDFSIEKIAHHLALGRDRLDRQLGFWQNFAKKLVQLGTSFWNLDNNNFDHDTLMLISRAAMRQICKTSVIYYPSLPNDRRVAMYINMILSPETLSELDMRQMQEDEQEGTTHWGLAMKAFFDPEGPVYPQHLDMVALLAASPFEPDPHNWVVKVLNNISVTYAIPIEPPPNDPGYRVPFLVLKELS